MHLRAFCAALLAIVVTGCTPRVILVRGGPVPGWVDHLPRRSGELCAVGYSGPTFYQEDGVKNAAENARAHLAESISVTIKAVTIDISDGTRGYFSKDVFVEGSESASEAVLQGSEVEAQWVDMQGQRGAQNGCYAMVCIDPDKPMEKFVEKLEEKKIPPKTVERVRQNAEAAFEELEKLEEKERQKKLGLPPPPAPGEAKPEEKPEEQPGERPEEAPSEEVPEKPPEGETTDTDEDATPAVRKIQSSSPRVRHTMVECTLSIIKPDAVEKRLTGKIVARFEEEGFRIVAMRKVRLSRKQAEGFYAVHRERPFFDDLVEFMTSGPVVVQVLERENAIEHNRKVMGATDPAKADEGTLRKLYASSIENNAVHGSDALETARTEIAYFFSTVDIVG